MTVVKALLRDTRDGHTGTYEYEVPDHVATLQTWAWSNHNNYCDCNRSRRLYPADPSKWLDCNAGTPNVIELVDITVERFL